MQLSLFLFAVSALSASSASNSSDSTAANESDSLVKPLEIGTFSAPVSDEISPRSPCPAFNALANHGYFPRDGSAIPEKSIVALLHSVLGADESLVQVQLHSANRMALNEEGADGEKSINLTSLRFHGKIEHDVSMFRDDFLVAGDAFSVNSSYVDLLEEIVGSPEGNVTLDHMGAFRKARYEQSKQMNSKLNFGPKQEFIAFTEAALLWKIMKGNQEYPRMNQIRAFVLEERLPIEEGWVKGKMSLIDFLSLTAVIKAKAGLFSS